MSGDCGLDASLSFLSTSRRCLRKRSPRDVCKAISDFNRSLGSCYFVRNVNERTSVASFARTFKSTRLIIRFKYTSN